MIIVKTLAEIENMRGAGKILGSLLSQMQKKIKAGMTTGEVDKISADLMEAAGVKSAFYCYRGFPGNSCISVNEEIVHGIPGERILQDGDIVSLDMGVIYKGVYSDAAITVAVGKPDPAAKRLIEITKKSLAEGIAKMQAGNRLSDISHAVQQYVEHHGFSVVRQFVGHGIGAQLHEDPEIPNFGRPGQGPVLRPGMVFAIEPMVNAGTWECEVLSNGWTAVTVDGKLSAHFEHTVALTENGPEILTKQD